MGAAPTCLNEVIEDMLALKKSLPRRPSFPEVEVALATIAKVNDEFVARQEEILRQAKPKDVAPTVFVALQEMRIEALESQAKEKRQAAEAVVELEERHRRYDLWIRRVHAALSSSASLASGADADRDADERTVYAESESKGYEAVEGQDGSAKSVLDAIWDFPPSESSVYSSVGVLSVMDDRLGGKPMDAKPSPYGRSNSFSRVAQFLSQTGEQPEPYTPPGDQHSKDSLLPVLSVDGGVGSKEGIPLAVENANCAEGMLSALDSAAQQKQTCLNLRGALFNEIEWIPESIGKMIWLTDLNLSSNRLTILPDSIGDMAGLVSLDVSLNQLMSLPDSIGHLTCLTTLILDNNKIEELPYTIGQCTSLTELRASFNQLKALPEASGKLTQLQCLDVHWNKLSGLPTTIASMSSLVHLDASFNEISHIPEGLCQVTTLTRLNLSSNFNELKQLPQDIGDLQKLEVLNLSCNQIKVLPDSFVLLTNLQDLDLSGNNLCVPPKDIADQGREAILKYMADLVAQKKKGKTLARKKSVWMRLFLFFACGMPVEE